MWLDRYAKEYGEKIRTGRRSTERIAKMTGLSMEHARALASYVRRGEVPKTPLSDPDEKVSQAPNQGPEQFLLNKAYIYNDQDDTYITFLPGVPKPLVLPGAVHREIVRAYSNYDGNPATVNEIARSVKLPRPWVVKYLRVHEITHDREPFTPEEIATRSDDDLIQDALQLRRASVYKKLEQAKWKEIRDDAMRWRSFEDHVLRAITAAIQSPRPSPEPIKMEAAKRPYAAVMGLTDFHWGKYSDPAENFEPYSRHIARGRLMAATRDVLGHLHYFGRPEKIIVPVGSDFLHIDNDQGGTSKGTSQDMDGTPAEILVTGCLLMEEWILSLASIAPVELVLMSGNHDRMSGLAILLYLEALFRSDPRVTAALDRTPRTYRVYGKNLIGFVHGDGVSRTTEMAGHMAREKAGAWACCPHRTIYTGHLHHEKTETDTSFSVTRRQIPSLAGPDRWHTRHGFDGSPKSLPVYLHDKESGVKAVLYGRVKKTL